MSVFQMLIWAAISALRSRYFFAKLFPPQKMSSTQAGLQIQHNRSGIDKSKILNLLFSYVTLWLKPENSSVERNFEIIV